MRKKNYEMTLMERIDFIRANSVTDDEFKMMKWCQKFDELLEQNKPEV